MLYLGALPFVWNLVTRQLSYFESSEWLNCEITKSILFILYFITYSQITGLPWSIYYTFVLEQKHGFNKQVIFFIDSNSQKYFFTKICQNLTQIKNIFLKIILLSTF